MRFNQISSRSLVAIALLGFLCLIFMPGFGLGEAFSSEAIQENINELKQQARTNQNDLNKQKTLLEKNSVKLYETLIRLEELDEQSVKYSDTLKTYGGRFESIQSRLKGDQKKRLLDTVNASGFWLFISTLLVFVLPVGFVTFEAGQIKKSEAVPASLKHMFTWVIVFLSYFVLGFGLMYGQSVSGIAGSSFIFLSSTDVSGFFNLELESAASPAGFLFFQIAFAMTAGLVIATALNNHLPTAAYGFIALCMAGFVYPVFGHWAWSSHLMTGNTGWLENIGFKDFAGSTVVHSVAAWFALVWVRGLKVTLPQAQTDHALASSHNSLIYTLIGVYILWFGWVGLVSGSHLQYDSEVIVLILNTGLAGAAAGVAATLSSVFWGKMKILGGVVGGFVAISAACDAVLPLEAILIGLGAGLVYQLGCSVLGKTLLSHHHEGKTVGVISAHGLCGIWGTLCVALFGGEGLLSGFDTAQFMIQLKGIGAAMGFSVISAVLCLLIYRAFSGFLGGNKPT